MDSLSDILGRRPLEEPAEIKAIKAFVEQNFRQAVGVSVQDRRIIISVPSAALANTLRLRTRELQQAAHTDKRLQFRIT